MPKIARLLGGLALLGVAFAGCASKEEKLSDLLASADERIAAGEHEEGLLFLRSALQLDPKSADLNLRIATSLQALRNVEEAAYFYGEAYRLDPTLTTAAFGQMPLLLSSEPEAGRALVDEILEREPQNAAAHAWSAQFALLDADTGGALVSALTAAELDPELAFAQRTLGLVYRAQVREARILGEEVDESLFEKAIQAHDRALQLQLGEGGGLRDARAKAQTYVAWTGHDAEAVEAWKAAYALAVEHDVVEAKPQILREMLQFASARDDRELLRWTLEKQADLAPDRVRGWKLLVTLEENQGRDGEVIWKRALERSPESLGLHAEYARFLAGKGRHADAVAHLEALPAEQSDTPQVRALVVEIQLLAGEEQDARDRAKRLIAEHGREESVRLVEARIQLLDGRTEDAAKTLRELAGTRERPDVFRLLHAAERQLGNLPAARAAIDRAIELDPTPGPGVFRARADLLAQEGAWEGVLATLKEMGQRGLRTNEGDVYRKARALYGVGRPAQARGQLGKLLREGDGKALLMIARHEGVRSPDIVRRHLGRALEQDASRYDLVAALAAVELRHGRPRHSLDAIEASGPGEALPMRLRLLRSRSLVALGRFEEAEPDARAALAARPPIPGSVGTVVGILQATNRRPEAIALLEETDREVPLGPRNRWLLGSMQLAEGDLETAERTLERALDGDPDLHMAKNDLAYVLVTTGGDLERAFALARSAQAALPEDPNVADTLGWVYYKRGLLGPAVDQFDEAIRLAEQRGGRLPADFHYHRALALRDLGRHGDAMDALDVALELRPQHEEAKAARQALAESEG